MTSTLKTVDLGLVPLELHTGNVGISISGGADSSLLLYLLMKHTDPETKIHAISCADPRMLNVNPRHAFNVLERCMELTGNRNVLFYTYFVKIKNSKTWVTGIDHYIDNKIVDVVYTGATSNPPTDMTDVPWLVNPPSETAVCRNPKDIRPLYSRNDKIYTPFTNIHKRQIAQLYREHNLMESLFPLTHSCEHPKFLHPTQCGECWWCLEREWGFNTHD